MKKKMKKKFYEIIKVALKAALTAALAAVGVNLTNGCAIGKNPTAFTLIERNN